MGVMAVHYVLDTNVALYLLGGRLLNPLPIGEFYLSIITEMEILSYPTISEAEELKVRQFLSQVRIMGVGEDVKMLRLLSVKNIDQSCRMQLSVQRLGQLMQCC
jgi:hypothetical protein